MRARDFVLDTADGWPTVGVVWEGDETSRGIVQIAHGAAEHRGRYARLAASLTAAGYVVAANDHRGHGDSVPDGVPLGVARPGGWDAIVADLHDVTRLLRDRYPDRPLVLIGHSMGGALAQQYLARWGDGLDAAVVMGSAAPTTERADVVGLLDAAIETEGHDAPSQLFAAMFSGLNAPWSAEDATGYEWLSRDADEVRAYVDDPRCGFTLSNGFVRDMVAAGVAFAASDAIDRTPAALPILVMSGDQDPVGGEGGARVSELADRYRRAGCRDVTLRLSPGARHELLNEITRDQVTADLVAWIMERT